MSLCVYAIVPATARTSLRGAAGEATRQVRTGAIAAVVGVARPTVPQTPVALTAYHRTIGRIAAQTPAILPARFNTRVADEDELKMILSVRQVSLRRALAHVRNRVQMTLRMPSVDPDPTPARIRIRTGSISESGTQYLRTRAELYRRPELDDLRAPLKRWIREERVEQRGKVATMYHLIPRASVAPYLRALRAAAGSRIVVTGPFPPFAFADTF